MKIQKKGNKGITLIALVITIIVLLILAGVTIVTLTGDNGLITKASDAKLQSEIAEEKDIISVSALQAQAGNNQGILEEDKFSEALDINSKVENKASIIAEDEGSFTVKFESDRYYEVSKNGNINYVENVTGEKTLTVQCINSNNEVLGEYEYLVLTDRYSKSPPNVDKYESSEERIEGEMTENKTIQVLYYLICDDDTTLVFTGLDANGNITTNENEIVSYMVGDGSSTDGNGLREKQISCVVCIPEKYNEKQVDRIGGYSFCRAQNIFKINMGDSIKIINQFFAFAYTNIKEVIIGKNVSNIGQYAFHSCKNLSKVIFKNRMDSYGNIFGESNNLKYFELSEDNDYYRVEDNILYSKDRKNLILVPTGRTGDFEIPESVQKINGESFDTSNVKKVIIRNNVKEIAPYFAFGKSLQEVIIGENLETISGYAFYHCNNLSIVIIESEKICKKLKNKGNEGNLVDYAETIYIKSNITEIGSYITDNFQVTETDKEGYIKYIKN